MIKKYSSHIIILTLTIIGCDSNHADMVIHNGTIYTMDDYNPIVESVVVKDGKIIHVGSTNNYKKFVGPNTEVLDLNIQRWFLDYLKDMVILWDLVMQKCD
jgi:Predicted metal-dependent hydrolase with the TIM-barrel fold